MKLFFLLGHPVRWRIVEILASGSHIAGEIAGAIAAEMNVERTVVSQHLRKLRDAEIIRVRRDWSNLVYRLDPRLTGTLRLTAEGLEALAVGGHYNDIVLTGEVAAGSDAQEYAADELGDCWCMQRIRELRRF